MIRNDQDWSGMARTDQDWSGMTRIGQEWSGMVKNDQEKCWSYPQIQILLSFCCSRIFTTLILLPFKGSRIFENNILILLKGNRIFLKIQHSFKNFPFFWTMDRKHDQEVQSTLDEDETLQCGGDDQNYIVEATQRVRIL